MASHRLIHPGHPSHPVHPSYPSFGAHSRAPANKYTHKYTHTHSHIYACRLIPGTYADIGAISRAPGPARPVRPLSPRPLSPFLSLFLPGLVKVDLFLASFSRHSCVVLASFSRRSRVVLASFSRRSLLVHASFSRVISLPHSLLFLRPPRLPPRRWLLYPLVSPYLYPGLAGPLTERGAASGCCIPL